MSGLLEKLRKSVPGSLVTLLYALGMALTLLQALDLLAHAWMAVALLTAIVAALSVASLDRRLAWVTCSGAAAMCVVWMLLGGLGSLVEVLQALELHLSGLRTALPLVSREAAVICCVLCGVASFFVTQRSAGPYPALVLVLLAVVLIWLSDAMGALWFLLPAIVACVTLLLQGEHEISAFRVLPLAAVTVLLSFAGVAIGGATIPALKEAADGLCQRIYDIFFFTGSRDEFSLADLGYYPQGEGQLGGPANPVTDQIMVVISPRQVYLRGVIRNVYTGRSWLDETGGKRYLWDSSRFSSLRSSVFDMELPQLADLSYGAMLERDPVIVRMLTGSASTLFVPQRVRSLKPEGDLVAYFNEGSEIFATRNLRQGDVWSVEAPIMEADDPGMAALLAACGSAADPHWDEVNRLYRALPEHLQQEVWDLAYSAVAGADTPYEMAMQLQYYLRNSFTYTLEAAEQSPDMDFVSTFLLLDKAGYCTHFASAMTVMCRMVGLPARYVEGFIATPDQEGMAVLTGEQGHAWTEVYFRGFGWLTFDATPVGAETVYITPDQVSSGDGSGEEPTPTPEEPEAATPTPEPTATPTPVPEEPQTTSTPAPTATETPPGEEALPEPQKGPSAVWGWLAVLLLLLGALVLRILWMTPAWQHRRKQSEFGRWLVWTTAAHDALRQMGLVRNQDETPMAFLARVDRTNRIPRVLSQLSGAESVMFYGHAEPLPEETKQAREAYGVIWTRLTRWQKIRMTLCRAFLPARATDNSI